MNYQAVLFDLDGTLLNTLNDLGNSVNRVLSQHGFPKHKLNEYRYFIGDGARTLIARSLPNENRNEYTIEMCLLAFQHDYGSHWNVETSPYDGIAETLDRLSALGVKFAVLSNKPHDFTQLCVEKYLSNWIFEVVLGQLPSMPKKPDPTGALLISQQMKIAPHSFIYVGDSAVDMQTANAAGMFAVAALWGFRSLQELQENGAQSVLSNPIEIVSLLK